jgi:hypothetical protein
MSEETMEIVTAPNWKARSMLIGGVIGALVGVAAAYLFIQNNTADDETPQISPGEGVKLGVLVFGLLRSIATLGEGK